jgi:1-aminocyclopropane-1-carboxylate deaminase
LEYHFGGYAKYSSELVEFINEFNTKHKIPLDPVYTGKMMYGLFNMIQQDVFKKGSRIIAIHTGGLQGIDGFNERFGNLID